MTTATRTRYEPTLEPQDSHPTTDVRLSAATDAILQRHPAVGFAVGIVRDGRLESFEARGYANIESRTPIDEDTVFRIASITKTFTAIAIMQLWERGLIDLDAPANDYLRSYKLVPSDPTWRPATVRDLLTHTAGIGEVLSPADLFKPDWGDSVAPGKEPPTLAEFYAPGLPVDVEPGTTFTYTNHGFATLGQIVEDLTGMSLGAYFREHIFEPLGMTDTELGRSDRLAARQATGYVLRTGGPAPVVDRDWVTAAASSVYSTVRDMSRYIAALMNGGTNDQGAMLRPDTLETMFAPHFQLDPRVPGMGLGFDRNPAGEHLLVGHGGILPGFNSQLFVAPHDRVGIIAVTTGAHLAMLWLPTEMGRLIDDLLGIRHPELRTDIPHHPEVWAELCGRYTFSGRLTDIRARIMTGAGAQVSVRGDRLMLRVWSPIPGFIQGFPLQPDDADDPYAFRIDLARYGLPPTRILFSRKEGLGVTGMHLDIFPMSFRKRRPGDEELRPAVMRRVAFSVGVSVAASIGATAAAAAGQRLRQNRRRGRAIA
jgi:CubicO group peptidase (beta-lactamase class C family)